MTKKIPEPRLGDMVATDVRITDVSALPAKYFLHDEVIEALRRVVRSDVVVHGNPVPPGADAVFEHYTMSAARKRLAIANDDLLFQVRRMLPGLVAVVIIIAALAAAVVWVWGAIHG